MRAAIVPNSAPISQTESAQASRIFLLCEGLASVVKSKSFPSLPKIASRTGPPTKANLNPAALKAAANLVDSGARSMSVAMASCVAAFTEVLMVPKVRAEGWAVALGYDPSR